MPDTPDADPGSAQFPEQLSALVERLRPEQ